MKKIMLLLWMCMVLPMSFADEEDNITIVYEDGTVEVMAQSDYQAMSNRMSVSHLDVGSHIVATAVSQPIYLTDSHYNTYYDDWRLEWIKAKDILSSIEASLAGKTIKVAVIDSGVYRNHSDLNLLAGYDFSNDDNDPHDYSGHGSHVAGIVASKTSGNDVTGVAPNVEILPIKVFSDTGAGGTDVLAQGLRYAIDEEADVINMSLRYLTYDDVILTLLNEAEAKGIVVVAATSNESNLWTSGDVYDYKGSSSPYGTPVGFPAAHATVLSVGSVTKNKWSPEVGISDYSNIKGQRYIDGLVTDVVVDVVAPGDEIVSWSQYGDDVTIIKSGTSMAAPHVAGLAAILKAEYETLSPGDIRTVIRETAYNPAIVLPALGDVGATQASDLIGHGLIDVDGALHFSPLTDLTASEGSLNFDPKVLSYTLTVPYGTDAMTFSHQAMQGSTLTIDGSSMSASQEVTLSSPSQTFVVEGTFGPVTKAYSVQVNKALPQLTSLTANGNALDTGLNIQSYLEGTDQVILNTGAPGGVRVKIDSVEESSHTYDLTSPQNIVIELTSDESIPRVNTYEIQVSKASDGLRLTSLTLSGTTVDIATSPVGDNTAVYDLGDFSYATSFEASGLSSDGGTLTYAVNGGAYNAVADFTGSGMPLLDEATSLDVKVSKDGGYNIYYFKFTRVHATVTSLDYTSLDPGEVSTFGHDLENNMISNLTYDEASVRVDATASAVATISHKVNTGAYTTSNVLNLDVGTNKVTTRVAFGNEGDDDYRVLIYNAIFTRSGNAAINALTYEVKSGSDTLVPYIDDAFSPTKFTYDLTLSKAMDKMTFNISPELANTKYSAKLNGTSISLVGDKVELGALSEGDHVLEIMNTYHYKNDAINKEELGYKQMVYTYRIHVVSGLALSEIYLTSDGVDQIDFQEDTLTYNISLLAGTEKVFKATKAHPSYGAMKWSVDGVDEDYLSTEKTLEFGKVYQLEIISPNASESRVYTFNLTERTLDTTSHLSQLNITGQVLTPAFAADQMIYASDVGHDVTAVSIHATRASLYSQMTIGGQGATPYSKPLSVGANTVDILIRAEDGSTRTYRLTINRAQAPISSGGTPGNTTSGGVLVPVVSLPLPLEAKDHVETIKDEDGGDKVLVEVSEDRIKKDLEDKQQEVVQVVLKDKPAGDIEIKASTLDLIGQSKKPLTLAFDDVTFKMSGKLLADLKIKDTLRVTFAKKARPIGGQAVSDVFDLDLFDGDKKVSFDVAIPIEVSYDAKAVKNKDNLAVYLYDAIEKSWVYAGGKVIEGNKILFEARHFSKYSVRENAVTFDDVQDHWAKEAIEVIASREITRGVSETHFAPDKTLSNAEFISLLVRILGLADYKGKVTYYNVEEDQWYTPYIKKAIGSNLIINTYGLDFEPLGPIKREEMASLLMASYFYYSQKEPGDMLVSSLEFAQDEGQVTEYFRDQVRMAYQLELIIGDDKNNFNPQKGATRAEAATVIQKLLLLLDLL